MAGYQSGTYMLPPMFSVPQVTWASQTIGQNTVGKFPNPRSVSRICEFVQQPSLGCTLPSPTLYMYVLTSRQLRDF